MRYNEIVQTVGDNIVYGFKFTDTKDDYQFYGDCAIAISPNGEVESEVKPFGDYWQ